MGFRWGVKWTQYKFIKEENGKFWLDEQELEAFEKRMKLAPIWSVIATILISAVIIAIVFLLS